VSAPYLRRLTLIESDVQNFDQFPYSLPVIGGLDIRFRKPITFFVGENGSGKSTIIETIADLAGLPISGGGHNELDAGHGPDHESELANAMRPAFARRPRDGYFFRAELQSEFASLLDARRADPDFGGNPYTRYGGKSLHHQSHGEAFLSLILNRMASGFFLMDEPESALSPQRQLALLVRMTELISTGETQFIVATHSPILLTHPQAEILSFDRTPLRIVGLEETSQYQITKGILEAPERYWRRLMQED
jgi:predicted ATPase